MISLFLSRTRSILPCDAVRTCKITNTLKWSSECRNPFVLLVLDSQWVLQIVSVMDLKWDKTPLLITVALSSSSYCHQKCKNQDGERRTNHRGCLIWIVLYLPQLAELVFSGVFAMSAGESGFLSPPDASSRFLHAVLKCPGTFSSCCLLLSWTWYAFCHLTSLGEIHRGPFPSESPTSRWNVAPCAPPALQRARKRMRQELLPRISE